MTSYTHGDANIWLTTIAAPSLGGITAVDTTQIPSVAIYDYVRFYELQNPVVPDTTKKDTAGVYPNSKNPQIIVDNSDAIHCTFNKAWTLSSGVAGFYGTNYAYISSTSSADYAIWTPDIPADGNYRIFMRWTENANRTKAGPVQISHKEGVANTTVNQTTFGGRWNFLGTFQLAKGNTNYVKITGAGGGYTVADAVLFECIDSAFTSVTKINDQLSGFSIRYNSSTCKTNISFSLQKTSRVSIQLYNSLGMLVNTIEPDQVLPPNQYTYELNHTNLQQGVYLASLDSDNRHQAVAKLIIK